MELTKLKVETVLPVSSVLHNPLEVKTGHEDFLRKTSFVAMPHFFSQV